MIEEQIEALVAQLERGEITKEQFQRRMNEIVDLAASDAKEASQDSVRRESIREAATMARGLS
jgi:hypothetical protein